LGGESAREGESMRTGRMTGAGVGGEKHRNVSLRFALNSQTDEIRYCGRVRNLRQQVVKGTRPKFWGAWGGIAIETAGTSTVLSLNGIGWGCDFPEKRGVSSMHDVSSHSSKIDELGLQESRLGRNEAKAELDVQLAVGKGSSS